MFGSGKRRQYIARLEQDLIDARAKLEEAEADCQQLRINCRAVQEKASAAEEHSHTTERELVEKLSRYQTLAANIATLPQPIGTDIAQLLASVDPHLTDFGSLPTANATIDFFEPQYGIGKDIVDLAAVANSALSDYFPGLLVSQHRRISLWPAGTRRESRPFVSGHRNPENDLFERHGPEFKQQLVFESRYKGPFAVCCSALIEFIRLQLGEICSDIQVVNADRSSGKLEISVKFISLRARDAIIEKAAREARIKSP